MAAFYVVSPVSAQEGRDVKFAGVAFTGPAAMSMETLPYASQALDSSGIKDVTHSLVEALRAVPPRYFSLDADHLAKIDGVSEALVLAISIDRETAYSEEIDGSHKAFYELAAQALFFDFRQKQIVFTYPITIQRISVLPHLPEKEDFRRMAHDVIGGNFEGALVPTVARELQDLHVPAGGSRRFQVVAVHVDAGASAMAPGMLDTNVLAHEFTKLIASNLRLPVLPHAAGQVIGGAMAARFADGRVFNLVIPGPDYSVNVDVTAFKSKTLKETPEFRQQLFGAYYRISVVEPLSGKVFFDRQLRQGNTRTVPATQTVMDTGAAYRETLLAGISSFTRAVQGGDPEWVKAQAEPADVATQIKSMKELVEMSR